MFVVFLTTSNIFCLRKGGSPSLARSLYIPSREGKKREEYAGPARTENSHMNIIRKGRLDSVMESKFGLSY